MKLIPIILIGFVLMFPIGFGGRAYIQAQQEKSHMASYLKAKYGKEFAVTHFRVEGAGFAQPGAPVAEAYPKDDKSLRFKIVDHSDNRYVFTDEYPDAVWSREATETLKPVLTQIFGYTPNYIVKIHPSNDLNNVLRGDFGGFQDGTIKYGNKINFSLIIMSNAKITKTTKQKVTEQSLQVIKVINSLGLNSSYIYNGPIEKGGPNGYIAIYDSEVAAIQTVEQINGYVRESWQYNNDQPQFHDSPLGLLDTFAVLFFIFAIPAALLYAFITSRVRRRS